MNLPSGVVSINDEALDTVLPPPSPVRTGGAALATGVATVCIYCCVPWDFDVVLYLFLFQADVHVPAGNTETDAPLRNSASAVPTVPQSPATDILLPCSGNLSASEFIPNGAYYRRRGVLGWFEYLPAEGPMPPMVRFPSPDFNVSAQAIRAQLERTGAIETCEVRAVLSFLDYVASEYCMVVLVFLCSLDWCFCRWGASADLC